MRINQSIRARQTRALGRKKAEARRREAQTATTDVICTVEEPLGSGSKCGGRSHDGIHARCVKHRDYDLADIGVHSGFRTTPTGQPARRKKVGNNSVFRR